MPIKDCPWQTIVEVRNDLMEKPVLATRGYVDEKGRVHPNPDFFTSVFTPDKFFPSPGGELVCPTEYRLVKEEPS